MENVKSEIDNSILELIFTYSHEMLCIVDKEGRFIRLNPEWERTLGYSPEEFINKSYSDFTHPDDITATKEITKKADNESINNFINRYRHKDGSYKWIEWRSIPIGNVIFAAAKDITEEKKYREKLKESQDFIWNLTKNIPGLLCQFSIDNSGKFSFKDIGESFIKFLESDKNKIETIHRDIYKSIPVDEYEIIIASIKSAISKKTDWNYQGKLVNKNNKKIIYQGISRYRNNNINNLFDGILIDITNKIFSEEQIRLNEEKFSIAFNHAPIGMCILEPVNNTIQEVNSKFCSMFGFSKKELINKPFSDLTHPVDKEYNIYIEKSENEDEYIKRYTHKNGNEIWGLERLSWISNKEGSYNMAIVHIQDITKLKLTERAFEERLIALSKPLNSKNDITFTDVLNINEVQIIQDTFAKATGIAALITDPKGIPITRPSNFCELCNLIRSTKKGKLNCYKSDSELGKFNPDGPNIKLCLSAGLFNAGAAITVGNVHIANIMVGQARDESIKEEELLKYADEIGIDSKTYLEKLKKVPFVTKKQFDIIAHSLFVLAKQLSIKAFQDVQQARIISEQKKVEKELFRSQKMLSNSHRIANLGSWEYHIKENMLYWSEESYKIFGFDKNSAPKDLKGVLQYIHPDDLDYINKEYERINETDEINELECRIINKNGECKNILTTGEILKDETGYNIIMTGIIKDITERKKNENEIKELNQALKSKINERTSQLEQANKDLESFAYSISHDLRAPLRHIDGFTNLLYSNIDDPNEQVNEYYEKIKSATLRMSIMIDKLLSFSRNGRKELNIIPVDMNKLVNEVIEQLTPDFSNREINWIINKLPVVNGDYSLLKVAFENIISNAIKYSSKQTVSRIEINNYPVQNNHFLISVKDNGVGFDMKYIDKLFGVFQRLHTNNEYDGIGIGLANANQIIKKHKGRITAKSGINKGAEFFIELPKLLKNEEE